jgi:hypothetical protein
LAKLHFGQTFSSVVPQALQNFVPPGFSDSQFGHFIFDLADERHHENAEAWTQFTLASG